MGTRRNSGEASPGAPRVRRDIIAIGASAGGIEALMTLLPLLPADLPASLFVIVHRAPRTTLQDELADLLRRRAKLRVERATDGATFERGRVYLAPPRSSLTLDGVHMHVSPCSGASRGIVTSLFESAAASGGARVIGVVLSGRLDDGTAGLWDIRRRGGITMVQDPTEAAFPAMPRSGLEEVPVHFCLPLAGLATQLVELTGTSAPSSTRTRVLIVEDERIVAANLQRRLADLGYDVVGAVATGDAALRATAEAAPDVVLMDVNLGTAVRGTEAARLLWERHRIPIVFLTAYSDEQTLAEAKFAHPHGFVVKPYREPQVHAAIQMALARRDGQGNDAT